MPDDSISVPYNRDLKPLEELLSGVRRPGDFFVPGSIETPMPRGEVEGVGLLSFPVPEAQVHQIVQQATRAPYGRGEETLHDESVRKTWQLPASQVHIGGKTWERTFTQLLNAVVAGLGCATAKTIRRSGNTFARIRFAPDWCRHRRAGRASVACTRFGGLEI